MVRKTRVLHNNRKQFGAMRPDAHFVRAAVGGRYVS